MHDISPKMSELVKTFARKLFFPKFGREGTRGPLSPSATPMGRLKMREWKNRHGRKCMGGKGGSGNIGTILQG